MKSVPLYIVLAVLLTGCTRGNTAGPELRRYPGTSGSLFCASDYASIELPTGWKCSTEKAEAGARPEIWVANSQSTVIIGLYGVSSLAAGETSTDQKVWFDRLRMLREGKGTEFREIFGEKPIKLERKALDRTTFYYWSGLSRAQDKSIMDGYIVGNRSFILFKMIEPAKKTDELSHQISQVLKSLELQPLN